MTSSPNRLATYLTAGLGVGCIAGEADAAITVTLYGTGAQNHTTTPATPFGIDVGLGFDLVSRYVTDSTNAMVAFGTDMIYFTGGTDLIGLEGANWGYGEYFSSGVVNGATLNSSNNFANITFNGADGVYEAVGQFYLDGAGGGYLIAMAINDDGSALTISQGKAAIDAIPEPSGLALLALGAGGLLARRRRNAA